MKIFRKQAILPLVLLAGVAGLYFNLFFDAHLRWLLSWGLTEINSAEVDIDALKTRFFPPQLLVGHMAWTQPDEPTRNRLELGALEVALNGDALLRGKWVVERAVLLGFQGGGLRAKPGRVYPPVASNPDTPMGKLWVRIKQEAAQTGLGQIAQILQGFDPRAQLAQLGDLNQLSSLKRMAELQERLNSKRVEWQSGLKQIPGEKELGALQTRVSQLSIGGNPAQIQSQISAATQIAGEAKGLVQSVQQKSSALVSDVNQVTQSANSIPEWIAQDQRDLEGRLKLPSLDSASITAQLLGPRLFGLLQKVEPYLHGSKTNEKTEKPASREGSRWTGRIYEFGHLKSLPRFWLKQGRLSGSVGAGTLEAHLQNWSSQPTWVAEVPRIDVKAQNFPVQAVHLVDADGIKLHLENATAVGTLGGHFSGDKIALKGELKLTSAQYSVAAQPAFLQDLLKDATDGLATTQLGVEVFGTWSAPEFRFSSTLGDAIARTVRSRLDAQVAQVRTELTRRINEKVGAKKQALTSQVESTRNVVLSEVSARQKQAEAIEAQAQSKIAQAQAQLSRSATDQLRKKLPF